jgi:hypothetical protein
MSTLRIPAIFYIFENRIHGTKKTKLLYTMQWKPTDEIIEEQRSKVFGPTPYAHLLRPCRINDGIVRIEDDQKSSLIRLFEKQAHSLGFFIPASGSGSRMLEFLYEYKSNSKQEMSGQMEHFINALTEFAFYKQLPESLQQAIQIQNFEIDELIDHILSDNGLKLGKIPKGLSPFHSVGPFILNPFQEHLLQGSAISATKPMFHFTIQKEFEQEISSVVKSTSEITGSSFNVSFSEQSVETNSIAFDSEGNVCTNNKGEMITRPSGHGALLEQLNTMDQEIVFIKNIDNIQHYSKSQESNNVWKIVGGLLFEYRNEAKAIFESPSKNDLFALNEKYRIFENNEIDAIQGADSIRELLNKPTRVCGMVKNEGQPGGGPFWVEANGKVSKQIVEKAQISTDSDQRNILLKSTHFNPVMIAICPLDLSNHKFDLTHYRDDNAFFIVHKTSEEKSINYMEQPGLWNGSMANWNTIFVEIPNQVFSPVKSVIDLLHPAHKE